MKILVRCGIPHEFRARVWNDLIRLRVSSDRELAGKGYYSNLLKEKQGVYLPSAKQIELDLLRTLPNNKYYDTLESEGVRTFTDCIIASVNIAIFSLFINNESETHQCSKDC